jgi:hypothetical protein
MLVIVSANVTIKGDFLHYIKGLKLASQLKTVFFNKCYVFFTDTFYQQKLQEL